MHAALATPSPSPFAAALQAELMRPFTDEELDLGVIARFAPPSVASQSVMLLPVAAEEPEPEIAEPRPIEPATGWRLAFTIAWAAWMIGWTVLWLSFRYWLTSVRYGLAAHVSRACHSLSAAYFLAFMGWAAFASLAAINFIWG